MNVLIFIMKTLIIQSLYFGKELYFKNKKCGADENALKDLKDSGIHVLHNYLTERQCKLLRDLIDDKISSGDHNVWVDDNESDHRIYFAEQVDQSFNFIIEDDCILATLERYLGVTKPCSLVLAARADAVEGNLGSGGGWHRDSPFRNQFKVLVYLNDVTELNGPFQIIKGSHKFISVIKSVVKKVFKPNSHRFTETDINNYCKAFGEEVFEVSGAAGTLAFIDTKCIHRGKPLESGNRYVLFGYFWENKIPKGFDDMRQSSNVN